MTSIWAICFNHGESCAVDKLPNYPMKLVIPEVVRREKVEEEEGEEEGQRRVQKTMTI